MVDIPYFWYHGISCISVAVADTIRNEMYNYSTLTRDGSNKLEQHGMREIYYSHKTNKLAAKVTSTLVSDITTDAACTAFVWDKDTYNKYYRKTPNTNSYAGLTQRAVTSVEFSVIN